MARGSSTRAIQGGKGGKEARASIKRHIKKVSSEYYTKAWDLSTRSI
jgi:hypothetical protein